MRNAQRVRKGQAAKNRLRDEMRQEMSQIEYTKLLRTYKTNHVNREVQQTTKIQINAKLTLRFTVVRERFDQLLVTGAQRQLAHVHVCPLSSA